MSDSKYSWLFYSVEAGAGKSKVLADALKLFGGVALDYEGRLGHFNLDPSLIKDMRPPFGKPERIVGQLEDWVRTYFKSMSSGKVPHGVIGVDSLTEAQFLIRLGMAQAEADESSKGVDPEMLSQRGWGKLGDRLAYTVGYLAPAFTKAHLIATAFGDTERGTFGGDDQRIRPALQGAMGKRLQKYFDFVVFVEFKTVKKEGVAMAVHRYHFAPSGDFITKNIFEGTGVIPAYIDNPTFGDLLELVVKAEKAMKGDN